MNLPNYFLADLPTDAVFTPAMITEACQTLRRNRTKYLAARSTPSLLRILSQTAENWLEPDYPFRKLALRDGPTQTGFAAATLATGLDAFFKQLTGENLDALLVQDLGHAQRLDRIDFTDRPAGCRAAANRMPKSVERLVLDFRRTLRKSSDLGEFGAAAIHRALVGC